MNSTVTKRGRLGTISWVVSLLVVVSGLMIGTPMSAQALSGSNFDPGHIIDDSKFYDAKALSEAQIQAFLVAKGSGLQSLRFDVASRARSVSESTGNVRCEAFTGGEGLLASTIIYRAQTACGISAKVLLVTLQKEQGLITKASPTLAALDRAMGMACPDTAPCAVDKLGFGNQIYEGTKQLNTYKAAAFAIQPGIRTIQWHPNAGCGSSTFVIENYATAALYSYTPYRPNAAALANLTGLGDGCSSYGNRNFWVYYSGWFGPTTGEPLTGAEQINLLYLIQGGASGTLGKTTSSVKTSNDFPGGLLQEFVGGNIYWTYSGGAHAVVGGVLTAYASVNAQAGELGWPTSDQYYVSANGGGKAQGFTGGSIYWSAASGGFAVTGAIRDAYWAALGEGGVLGWPTAAQTCTNSSNCSQTFQHGNIVWNATTGAHVKLT